MAKNPSFIERHCTNLLRHPLTLKWCHLWIAPNTKAQSQKRLLVIACQAINLPDSEPLPDFHPDSVIHVSLDPEPLFPLHRRSKRYIRTFLWAQCSVDFCHIDSISITRNDIVTVDVSESQILALRDKQIFEFTAELPDWFSKWF